MMSFDLSFISMLIEKIVEYEVALWTEGRISWLSINIGYNHGKKLHVVDFSFCLCVGV